MTDSDTETQISTDTGTNTDSDSAVPEVPTAKSGLALLEREGDIAADYLEALLDIADLDGDIDLDVDNGRASVSIVGTGLEPLVGKRGEVLDALQDLARLAVARESGDRSRLMLDIAGFRAAKKVALWQVGLEAAAQAIADGTDISLDPMNSFERKVVHDAVATTAATSESEGAEPRRFVVVSPPA